MQPMELTQATAPLTAQISHEQNVFVLKLKLI